MTEEKMVTRNPRQIEDCLACADGSMAIHVHKTRWYLSYHSHGGSFVVISYEKDPMKTSIYSVNRALINHGRLDGFPRRTCLMYGPQGRPITEDEYMEDIFGMPPSDHDPQDYKSDICIQLQVRKEPEEPFDIMDCVIM